MNNYGSVCKVLISMVYATCKSMTIHKTNTPQTEFNFCTL